MKYCLLPSTFRLRTPLFFIFLSILQTGSALTEHFVKSHPLQFIFRDLSRHFLINIDIFVKALPQHTQHLIRLLRPPLLELRFLLVLLHQGQEEFLARVMINDLIIVDARVQEQLVQELLRLIRGVVQLLSEVVTLHELLHPFEHVNGFQVVVLAVILLPNLNIGEHLNEQIKGRLHLQLIHLGIP